MLSGRKMTDSSCYFSSTKILNANHILSSTVKWYCGTSTIICEPMKLLTNNSVDSFIEPLPYSKHNFRQSRWVLFLKTPALRRTNYIVFARCRNQQRFKAVQLKTSSKTYVRTRSAIDIKTSQVSWDSCRWASLRCLSILFRHDWCWLFIILIAVSDEK